MSVPAAPKRYGIVYGFRALGDWGELSDGYGTVYYFGRTRQRSLGQDALLHDKGLQNEALVRRLKFGGLNRPSRMVVWIRVPERDLDAVWDRVRDHLKGSIWRERPNAGVRPVVTNHLEVGDNWFTVNNMNCDDFSEWCEEIAGQEVRFVQGLRVRFELAAAALRESEAAVQQLELEAELST